MSVKAMYIPISERGRKVARYRRGAGYEVRDVDVLGSFVMNLPCAHELTFEDLRHIAYSLEPESAWSAEEDALQLAQDMRENPQSWAIAPAEVEMHAMRMACSWVL